MNGVAWALATRVRVLTDGALSHVRVGSGVNQDPGPHQGWSGWREAPAAPKAKAPPWPLPLGPRLRVAAGKGQA